jgi:mannose-1-phosphate guanylyltransferase
LTRGMILAAGLGTRLGALSDERPKPLLPVADIPLIRYAVALLHGAGVRELVVNLHHRGDLIQAELGDAARYSPEERILGTGGGIRRALPLLGDEAFFVVNGKIVIEVELADVLRAHRASGALATLVVRPDPDARRWNAIDAPEGGGPIRSILGDGDFMFTGIHVIEPALVARLPDDDAERCIVRQGYIPWLAAGAHLHAYVAPGYFQEHSTPERYLEGNVNVLRGRAHLRWPPGPLSGVDPTARVDGEVVAPVKIGAGAVVAAGAVVGPDAVVGARARVAPGVRVARSVVWPDSEVAGDADGAIVTPRQRLTVSSPPAG